MSEWGTSQWGVAPWGGYGARGVTFRVETAYAVDTRAVRVGFTDPPVCLLKTNTNDVLRRDNWTVRVIENPLPAFRVLQVRQVSPLLFDVVVNKDLARWETPHGVRVTGVQSIAGHTVDGEEVTFRGMLRAKYRTDGDFFNRAMSGPPDGPPGTFVRTGAGDIAMHYGADVITKCVRRLISERAAPFLKGNITLADMIAIERDIKSEYGNVQGLTVGVSMDANTGVLLITVNGMVYTIKE